MKIEELKTELVDIKSELEKYSTPQLSKENKCVEIKLEVAKLKERLEKLEHRTDEIWRYFSEK